MKKQIVYINEFGLPMAEFDDGTGKAIPRVMGLLPPRPTCNLPDFTLWNTSDPKSHIAFLPENKWQEICYRHLIDEILDQKKTSACGAFATTGAFRASWLADGRTPHRFDPFFSYGLVNGGQDNGSVLSDLLEATIKHGICLNGDIPAGAMFRYQFPSSAFETAHRFRISQAFKCNSFEDLISAISCGFMVVFGIIIARNFGDLDNEGVPPKPDVQIGGHGLCGVGTKKLRNGEWSIDTLNSWSKTWGENGFCKLTKRFFGRRLDAFAIQTPHWDPQESGPPPVTSIKNSIVWSDFKPIKNKSRKGRRKQAA